MSRDGGPEGPTRLGAMRLRTGPVGLLAMLAVAAAGCGSGGSGFPNDIPSQSADGLLAYLNSVQSACETGDRFAARDAAQSFATAVDRLPSSVDASVRTVLRRGADNLMRLARKPQECSSGPTGATGLSGAQTETTETATTPSTATTSTTKTRTETTTTATTPTTTTGETTGGETTSTGGGASGESGGGNAGGSTTGSGGVSPGGGVAPGPGERGGSEG
jgi:hypothetical protein